MVNRNDIRKNRFEMAQHGHFKPIYPILGNSNKYKVADRPPQDQRLQPRTMIFLSSRLYTLSLYSPQRFLFSLTTVFWQEPCENAEWDLRGESFIHWVAVKKTAMPVRRIQNFLLSAEIIVVYFAWETYFLYDIEVASVAQKNKIFIRQIELNINRNMINTGENFVVYKSSAGSGKTYTLVKEYLKILLAQPSQYKHILAVTFTNKATDEMKSRIIDKLAFLSQAEEAQLVADSMYQELVEFLQKPGDRMAPDIPRRAAAALRFILNDYSQFSVSTIESFFQRIVRSFSRELDIPLGYDIEMKQDVVLDRLVRNTLDEVGAQPSLTLLLQKFLDYRLEDSKGWHVEGMLKQLGNEIFKEHLQPKLVDVSDHEGQRSAIMGHAQALQEVKRGFESKMTGLAQTALDLMHTYGLQHEDFKNKDKGPTAFFKKVVEKEVPGRFVPGKRFLTAIEAESEWYTQRSPQTGRIIEVLEAGLMGIARDMADLYGRAHRDYFTAHAALQTIFSFGVLQDLHQKLKAYRIEHNQLMISDTAYLLHLIVAKDNTPFIFERVGTRYHYYLLDEFQDTSDMQWANLKPLILEALAIEASYVLLVGDVKQAIYRWRNSNLQLLMAQAELDVLQEGGRASDQRVLAANYRSSRDIVGFNNRFFSEAVDQLSGQFSPVAGEVLQQAYQTASQDAKRQFPGYVHFELIDQQQGGELSWEELAMEKTLEMIGQAMALGFKGGDVAILVRKKAEGSRLATYLQARGLKVQSSESLLLINHPGVALLTAALTFLNHEADKIAHAAIRVNLAQIMGIKASDHRIFDPNLPEKHPLYPVWQHFLQEKNKLQQLPVYECVEQLCRIFPGLREPNAYLKGFLNAVLEYSATVDASISGFLHEWEEQRQKRSIAMSESGDAIQIMTIHKAKGLEFPVVILPMADWELGPKSRSLLWVETRQVPLLADFEYFPLPVSQALSQTHFEEAYQAEILRSYLDNLNLLYVALTRPQQWLVVCAPYKAEGKSGSRSGHLSRMGALVSKVLPQLEAGQRIDHEQSLSFIWGEPVPPAVHHESFHTRENLLPLGNTHNGWDEVIRVRFRANHYLPDAIEDQMDRMHAGELIHEALAFVGTVEDIPRAVDQLRLKGQINAGQVEGLTAQLEAAVTHPDVIHWFNGDWEVKNEADIFMSTGEILRPDRVLIRGKAAVVVDYKTGKPLPKYARQVKTYVRALQEMGYSPVSGYVYYVGDQVEQVV